MQIKSLAQTVPFKAYVPVSFFTLDENGAKQQICNKQEYKKCQNYVVRNLNGTLKNCNQDFIDFYKNADKDYQKNSVVRSVYDKTRPIVFMVTGDDTDYVDKSAKQLGITKSQLTEPCFKKIASNEYFYNVFTYLKKSCTRLKSENGNDLSLHLFFAPKYNKKNEIKKFEYLGGEFVEKQKNKTLYR